MGSATYPRQPPMLRRPIFLLRGNRPAGRRATCGGMSGSSSRLNGLKHERPRSGRPVQPRSGEANPSPDRRRRPGRLDGLHPPFPTGRSLAARRAPCRHRHPSQGPRHQRPNHGDVPPVRCGGGHPRRRPRSRAHGSRRLDDDLVRCGDRASRSLAGRTAESGRQPDPQLPLRPGRAGARAARLRRSGRDPASCASTPSLSPARRMGRA